MRYLVLSDIHSNIVALEAVLARAAEAGYERVFCCGDIVGYGPNPMEVMDRLEALGTVCIRGNHDRIVSGLDEPTYFNTAARQAAEWTRRVLPNAYLDRLAALPQGPLLVDGIQLVHGSIHDEDEYVVTDTEAMMALAFTHEPLTFFGHTHLPGVFETEDARHKQLVNPGSVGQPRDHDPRASFLIWDSDTRIPEFHRTQYDIAETQARMRVAGLPPTLAARLGLGR